MYSYIKKHLTKENQLLPGAEYVQSFPNPYLVNDQIANSISVHFNTGQNQIYQYYKSFTLHKEESKMIFQPLKLYGNGLYIEVQGGKCCLPVLENLYTKMFQPDEQKNKLSSRTITLLRQSLHHLDLKSQNS